MRTRNYNHIIVKDQTLHHRLVEKGYFIAKTLDAPALQILRDAYDTFMQMSGGETIDAFKSSVNFKNAEAVKFSREKIDSVFRNAFDNIFISEKVTYTGGVFLIKPSGADTYHKLHCDRALVDEINSYGLYSWTPITETSETTGKLFVVPKSNYSGNHQRSPSVAVIELNEDLYRNDYEILDIKAGETIFFDTALMHGSLANTSGRNRVAVNFFIKPADTPYMHFARNNDDDTMVDVFEIQPEFFFSQEHHSNSATGKYKKLLRTEKLLT